MKFINKKTREHRSLQLRTIKKCFKVRFKEPLAPWTPHGVITVKKDIFTRVGVWKTVRAWEKCFGRCDEERWGDCEGLRRAREWKMWWITSTAEQKCVHTCVVVSWGCAARNRGRLVPLKTSFLHTGPCLADPVRAGGVHQPPSDSVCPRTCMKMNVMICVCLRPPPEACAWWPECVWVALCRNLPAYFGITAIVCVCWPFLCFFTGYALLVGAPLPLSAPTFSGQRAHSNAGWIFNALYIPARTFNVTPARETLLGFYVVEGR